MANSAYPIAIIKFSNTLPEELTESSIKKFKIIRSLVVIRATRFINKIVPKDTGDLRKNMISTIKDSYIDNDQLVILFGASNKRISNYMEVVNTTKKKVAHHVKDKRLSRSKTDKYLHDPYARKKFIQIIIKDLHVFIKKHVKIHLLHILNEYQRKHPDAKGIDNKGWWEEFYFDGP